MSEIIVEIRDHIGVISLNRPEVLNALNTTLMKKLTTVLGDMDQNKNVKCIIIQGNEKVFAAGADIGEMSDQKPSDFVVKQFFSDWDKLRKVSKPIIASVRGYALGGGCELAMCCDLIVASENARFGQPEINLGIIPGAGGTQRLTRAIGKTRAMEMILTGKHITAAEALQFGLVNRVVSNDNLETETLSLAKELASKPGIAIRMAKQAINKASDLSLEEGLCYEQNAFNLLFSTEDQSEGMQAFKDKRAAVFQGV